MTTQVGQSATFFSAVVEDIREESRSGGRQRWQMLLSRTEFRAAPGFETGVLEAVAPSGARLTVPVLGVILDDEDALWHVVEKPVTAGTEVTGRVG